MSTRIDGQRFTADSEAAQRLESARTAERSAAAKVGARTSGTDRVEVSSDAQLVAAAVQAAQDVPDVRADAVERGRQLLAQGDLGRDADRLADRLIDALLKG